MKNKQSKFKRHCLFLPLLLLSMLLGFSQEEKKVLKINIVANFKEEPIQQNKWYVTNKNDSIQLSQLKFYLTNFAIQTKDKKRDAITNSNYLIDVFDEEIATINISNINYDSGDELLLNIGVDESLNTSGANSGDLDSSKGMFWSWQSGYINFKIEGKSPSCKTRKNKFQFHIGGYQEPYKTIRGLTFKLHTIENNTLKINLDVSRFFESIALSSQNQIMIPGKEATTIADTLPKLFSLYD